MASTSVWDEFEFDPRSAQYGSLRASDADRDVVHRLLGGAYADGRINREEFDERSEAVLAARTLAELPVLMSDLVPVSGLPVRRAVPADEAVSLQARAVAAYRADVREAAWGFVSASIVCWVILGVTSGSQWLPMARLRDARHRPAPPAPAGDARRPGRGAAQAAGAQGPQVA